MPEYTPPTPQGFFDQYFSKTETPPEGFLTTRQVAKIYGISEAAAKGRLERLVASGEAERRQYRIVNQGGCAQEVWHYGPAPRKEPGH